MISGVLDKPFSHCAFFNSILSFSTGCILISNPTHSLSKHSAHYSAAEFVSWRERDESECSSHHLPNFLLPPRSCRRDLNCSGAALNAAQRTGKAFICNQPLSRSLLCCSACSHRSKFELETHLAI